MDLRVGIVDQSYEFVENLIEKDYDYTAWGAETDHLHVASRGGTGHIMAMLGILELYLESSLTLHTPVPYCDKPSSSMGYSIFVVSKIEFIRESLQSLGIISIPELHILKEAI